MLTPSQLEEILAIEASLEVPFFSVTDAWDLGSLLRTRLLFSPKPVIITILAPSPFPNARLLFHTVTPRHAGSVPDKVTGPDNDVWVARKTKTVLRFGVSSYYMGVKFGSMSASGMDESAFATKYGLHEQEASQYAIHGGAVPVRVKGVEGVVAVVVVSGLKQEEDHAVVVEVMQEWIKTLE
ncbi:hypothetical protein BP5796_13248 [Coleophoma crateriformis]|uniref:Uncharacterized protein n=1 Tax=Coleophoma crateriformis TaxID=565419 RepID=A0A3D8Q394_9HELO|nr:hypothetical protein BP5796_13248 [Coleophoma crateriformis]